MTNVTKQLISPRISLAPLLLLIVLAGCGKTDSQIQNLQGAQGLQSYVEKFSQDAARFGRQTNTSHVVVQFGTVEKSGAAGECKVDEAGNRTIVINEEAWSGYGKQYREMLIYHELGHCVLNRTHSTDLGSDGNPDSLMYPNLFYAAVYEFNRDGYLNELFTKE